MMKSLSFLKKSGRKFFHFFCLLLAVLVLTSCASYQHKMSKSRSLIEKGRVEEALTELKPLAEKPSDDQLVYLFDYGTALQMTGHYKESNQYLLEAADMVEIKDYHSISRVTGSLLLSEGMIQYKGDDYEKVLVNAMLAINFLSLGELDSALVETKRLNEKLYKYKFDGKKDYEQNEFAFYLAALIWESDRKWDDAYIDFKKVFELHPNFPYLKEDLIRASYNARRMEDYKKWKQKFPEVKENPKWRDRSYGELVLVYQQGWAPRKRPRPENFRFPKLYPVSTYTQRAKLIVDQGEGKTLEEMTEKIYSVEDVAIKVLEDDYGRLVASRMAGVVTKAVVADQIRQKNEGLGNLAWIVMNVADQADLRQWSTLPESFQLAKIPLKAGKYRVMVEGYTINDYPTKEQMPWQEIEIKPRRKTFLSWRSLK